MIFSVDPLLEPAYGPNAFPFDNNILDRMHVDINHDATDDIVFEFRFTTEQRRPSVPVGIVGAGDGIGAPANSPRPIAPGTPLIPPAVTMLDGKGSQGLGLRQSYRVWIVKRGERRELTPRDGKGKSLFPVPSNLGPRTKPQDNELFQQGIRKLDPNIRVFAGTTDDAFFIDQGAAFDSLNFRVIPAPGSTGVPAVLSAQQDAAKARFVQDDVSGSNVNTIALDVPIALLTKTGTVLPASAPEVTVGTYGSTAREQIEQRDPLEPIDGSSAWVQVQRMGSPLVNKLIIGRSFKDRWSRDEPVNDVQFASCALDPRIARVAQARLWRGVRHPQAAARRPLAGRHLRTADRRQDDQARTGRGPAPAEHRAHVHTVRERQPARPARQRSGGLPERKAAARRRHRRHAAVGRRRRPDPQVQRLPEQHARRRRQHRRHQAVDQLALRRPGAERARQPPHRPERGRLRRRSVLRTALAAAALALVTATGAGAEPRRPVDLTELHERLPAAARPVVAAGTGPARRGAGLGGAGGADPGPALRR